MTAGRIGRIGARVLLQVGRSWLEFVPEGARLKPDPTGAGCAVFLS